MPLEHLNTDTAGTTSARRPLTRLVLVDPAPAPPSDARRLGWDEELELMRWADDGGANHA